MMRKVFESPWALSCLPCAHVLVQLSPSSCRWDSSILPPERLAQRRSRRTISIPWFVLGCGTKSKSNRQAEIEFIDHCVALFNFGARHLVVEVSLRPVSFCTFAPFQHQSPSLCGKFQTLICSGYEVRLPNLMAVVKVTAVSCQDETPLHIEQRRPCSS